MCVCVCLQSRWTMKLQRRFIKIEATCWTWTPLPIWPLTTSTMQWLKAASLWLSSTSNVRHTWSAGLFNEREHMKTVVLVLSPTGDAVSVTFLSSFIEVADRLAGKQASRSPCVRGVSHLTPQTEISLVAWLFSCCRVQGPDECGRLWRVDPPVRGPVTQLPPHAFPANHDLPLRLAAPAPGVSPALQRHAGYRGAASLHRAVRSFPISPRL